MENDINLFEQIRPLLEVEKYRERYRYTDVAKALEPNYGIVMQRHEAPIDILPYYNTIADNNDPLTALNTSFDPSPLVVYIAKGTVKNTPIRIENTLSGDVDTMVVRRVLIIMEENTEATILLVDHMTGQSNGNTFLTSQVVEVFCGENAHLDMYDMEETSNNCRRFSNLYISASRNAVVRHNNITMTNGITRNGIDVLLKGTGAEVVMNGVVVADENQHVDNNTLVVHEVPGCSSNQLYKYVADDNAIAAFAGKILVKEGAQQTASQMTNNNMCCSDTARIYTQPMLEIYADDVKCAHGSTVGVMDSAAVFYMQQRGIDEETARMLLKNAFVSQVVDEMKWAAFRDRLHILMDKRLSKEDRCGTCQLCS